MGGWGAGRGQRSWWLGPGRWQRVSGQQSGGDVGGRVSRTCWRVNCKGPFPVLLTSDLTPVKQEFLVCRSQLPLHGVFWGRRKGHLQRALCRASWHVERARWIEALNPDVDRDGSSHPVRRRKWRPVTLGPLAAERGPRQRPHLSLSSRESSLRLPTSTQAAKPGWISDTRFGFRRRPLKPGPAARAPFAWLFNDSGSFRWSLIPGGSSWRKTSGGWDLSNHRCPCRACARSPAEAGFSLALCLGAGRQAGSAAEARA